MSELADQHEPDRPARAVIIKAAADLFGEKGYHGTSVRDMRVDPLHQRLSGHFVGDDDRRAQQLEGANQRVQFA